MKKEKRSISTTLLTGAALTLESLGVLSFLAALPVVNAGNIAGVAACALPMAATIEHEKTSAFVKRLAKKKTGIAAIISACVIFAAGVGCVTALSAKMIKQMKNEPAEPKVLIVLGCQVRGDRPSKMLRRRLDTAYDALMMHPDAVCVVTGGKGTGENISEGDCMRNYLLGRGIPSHRIITENRSTSTYENLQFAKKLIDERELSHDVTLVTDGFHQYRASLMAMNIFGSENITAYSAKTEPRFIPTYWVREWLGITEGLVTGKLHLTPYQQEW